MTDKFHTGLPKGHDTADRSDPLTDNGAFFVPFEEGDENKVIEAFQQAVIAGGLSLANSAIVCRASEKKRALRNYGGDCGQGSTKLFAAAARARDSAADYQEAYRITVRAIVGLIKNPPSCLAAGMLGASRYPEFGEIRKMVWEFARNPVTGLPPASLRAESEWHPRLLYCTKNVLGRIQEKFGYLPLENLGSRLNKAKLSNEPIATPEAKRSTINPALQVETVHGVKGESLDAVLYLAGRDHVKAMIEGTNTELGRIGYVALTRARNLFWLGLLKEDASKYRQRLIQHSFFERYPRPR